MIRRKINSGAPGIPNNDGLRFARGEYISFLESDDAITRTAFEEMYSYTKNFDADVICCETFYVVSEEYKMSQEIPPNLETHTYPNIKCVTEPAWVSDKIDDRVNELYDVKFLWQPWSKLIKRSYILENNLQMVNVNHHDMLYTCCLVCSAKKILRVPNIINFYRIVGNSLSHKKEDIQKTLSGKLKTIIEGFNYIDKFLDTQENFKNRADLKYMVLDRVVREFVQYILHIYVQVPAYQFDEILREEFKKHGDNSALSAFLFSRMNIFNLQLLQQQQIIQQLQK